jgi:hypothetical protein
VVAKKHIKNSWFALIIVGSAFAIDSVIWILSATVGVVH